MLQNIFHIDTAFAGVITDAPPLTSLFMNVLNFLLSIIGVLGIIGLVISGVMYLSAGGNDEQMKNAKSAMMGSVIGLIVALGALVLTSQLTSFFSS